IRDLRELRQRRRAPVRGALGVLAGRQAGGSGGYSCSRLWCMRRAVLRRRHGRRARPAPRRRVPGGKGTRRIARTGILLRCRRAGEERGVTMFASRSRMFIAVLAAAAFALAQAEGEDVAFMPKGGRTLLLELMGASSAQLRGVAQERRTEAQWREFVDTQKKPMSQKERATLAAYLFVNMPVAPAVQGATALPPDGRDLAWDGCQNCHSLFAGY